MPRAAGPTRALAKAHHLDGLPVPIEIRPHIGAALAAGSASKSGLDIREPDIVGPIIGIEPGVQCEQW